MRLAYVGIGVSMLASYYSALGALFFEPFWVKALVATSLLCSSAAFASILFIRSFAEYRFSGQVLGSKLLRALMGGMLESASMGIRSLIILAAALCLLSFLYFHSARNVGGADLPWGPADIPAVFARATVLRLQFIFPMGSNVSLVKNGTGHPLRKISLYP